MLILLINHPILFLLVSFAVMWGATHLGLLLRRWRHPGELEDSDDYGLILGATLTLLGLLIGFTFSMASGRYDQRKNYEEEEANAIGTEYVRVDCLPAADCTQPLTGLGFDVDRLRVKLKKLGQVVANAFLYHSELRRLREDHNIHIDNFPPRPVQASESIANKITGIATRKTRVRVGIGIADVTQASGAKEGIGHGVQYDVSVAMAHKTRPVRNPHSPEDQRPAGLEPVRIMPDPDAHFMSPRVRLPGTGEF